MWVHFPTKEWYSRKRKSTSQKGAFTKTQLAPRWAPPAPSGAKPARNAGRPRRGKRKNRPAAVLQCFYKKPHKQHHPPAIQRDRGITADAQCCSMDQYLLFLQISITKQFSQKCVLLERFPAPAFLYKPNLCLFQNPTGSYLHIDAFESWFGTTGELELFSWFAQSLASSNSDEDFP